jgi:hypothetical protein
MAEEPLSRHFCYNWLAITHYTQVRPDLPRLKEINTAFGEGCSHAKMSAPNIQTNFAAPDQSNLLNGKNFTCSRANGISPVGAHLKRQVECPVSGYGICSGATGWCCPSLWICCGYRGNPGRVLTCCPVRYGISFSNGP